MWGPEELPAVVCLHEVGGHARRFERLARMLDDARRVVAYDLRGHGRSPWSGPQSLDQHVADLDDVMEAAGVETAALVGHGLGGLIGLRAASRQPERVTALVLLDPPLFTPGAVLHDQARAARAGAAYATVDEAIDCHLAEGGLRHTPRALLEEELAEHLVAGEDGRFRPRFSREAASAALEELAGGPPPALDEVACPTLLVRGAESELIEDEDVAQASAQLPHCTARVVPGGHMVLWDALAETGALVRQFLLVPQRSSA
jgi:lipase